MPVFNIDDLLARSLTFQLGGTEYTLSELTVGDRAEIGKILREIVPNPLTEAKAAIANVTNPAVAQSLWKEAGRQYAYWPPTLESDEGQALLFNNEKIQHAILYHGLKRNESGISKESVQSMLDKIPFQGALLKLLLFALTGNGGDDPKDH